LVKIKQGEIRQLGRPLLQDPLRVVDPYQTFLVDRATG
jgi:hypothetical protein